MKIIFKGELSPVCKTQIIKRGRRFNKIIITSAIFSVVGTGLYILGFVYNNPLFLYLGRPICCGGRTGANSFDNYKTKRQKHDAVFPETNNYKR